MAEKCNECLFTENRVVREGRMADIIKDCRKRDTFFVCHKATLKNKVACCRGFYDSQDTTPIQLADRLGVTEFVKEEEL